MRYLVETTASIERGNEIVDKDGPGPASHAVATVVAAIVMCTLTLLAPSSALSLANGDFEAFTGGLPDSWLYSQGDGPPTLQSPLQSPFTDIYPLGNNSVRFTDGPAPDFRPFLRQNFPAQTGQTAFTFDFVVESLSGNVWNVVLAGDGGSTAFLFDIDRNGQLQINGLTGPSTFVTNLAANQWYSVRGVADIGTHTLSGSVIPFGQSPIAFNNVPFSTFRTSLDEFQIADTNAAGLNSPLNVDNVSVGAAAIGSICDIQLSQTTFVNGNQVIAQVARLANPGPNPVPVEVKLWFELPGSLPPVPFLTVGADGSFVLLAGSDQDFGPLNLVTVLPSFPRGPYSFNCRLLHAVTGALLGEDFNAFQLQ